MWKYVSKLSNLMLIMLLFSISYTVPSWSQVDIPEPSFEDVISLRRALGPVISPNGKTIAFTVRTTDWKNNRYDSEIWLVCDGEKPFQLTRTKDKSSNSPRWSPNGNWIAFLADRGDKNQIYLIRPYGGEAQKITEVKEGIKRFRWAPGGKQIAFTMSEEESSEKKDREEQYGKYAIEDDEYRYTHLWIVDVKTDPWPSPAEVPCYKKEDLPDSLKNKDKPDNTSNDCITLPKPKQITKGDSLTIYNFEWSPDGTRIAFDHCIDPLINSYITSNISILTIETGEIKPLVTDRGSDRSPIWSPDSKWILYYSAAGDTTSDYYKNNQLYKIPAVGGKSFRLAKNLDEDVSNAVWTSKGIYLLAWQHTKRHIFRVDHTTGKAKLYTDRPDNIWSMNFSKDGNTLAFSGQTAKSVTEIYKTKLSKYRPVILSDMSKQIRDWELGTSEIISWKSVDGELIEGVLHKPNKFDPKHKYPLFVVIHGGPTGIDVPTPVTGYVYPINQWLTKGALVLRPNYRGSAGYGEAFRSLNVRNLGVGDAWDVLSGVDYLINQGIVDSTRMGAMGWSQGGFISAFLTTNTNRFKAISVGAGISNWVTYYVNTDIHPFTRQYLKATPWDDQGIYLKTSPITNIKQAKTPTLIQHGEFDKRVPIPNAYELYQGLQDMGVETRLVVYKGFGHGINKPKERLAAMWHNWQWFAKYIWGEELELPLKKEMKETKSE